MSITEPDSLQMKNTGLEESKCVLMLCVWEYNDIQSSTHTALTHTYPNGCVHFPGCGETGLQHRDCRCTCSILYCRLLKINQQCKHAGLKVSRTVSLDFKYITQLLGWNDGSCQINMELWLKSWNIAASPAYEYNSEIHVVVFNEALWGVRAGGSTLVFHINIWHFTLTLWL